MAEPGMKLIDVLLDRLYANLVDGPLMSCRPYSSRQRIDLVAMSRLRGATASQALTRLLGQERSVRLLGSDGEESAGRNGGGQARQEELRGLLTKMRGIADDARTYEEDTGAQALFLGFPLLHIPPDSRALGVRSGKRILAPLAFVPLRVAVKTSRPNSVILEAIGDGGDLVVPNVALLAWVERVTGKPLQQRLTDDGAEDPWREINEIAAAVAQALDVVPPLLVPDGEVVATPRADNEAKTVELVPSAVVGLFPAANQGLLADLEALRGGERAVGPIESFLKARTELGMCRSSSVADTTTALDGSERCISLVDPCQARAVHLARRVNGLVIHGPPGTGKSQTIANIIGDHLANGERVLFVCDKRTALDVVAYRLESLGLGPFCAVVHDIRRDARELYRGLREQLDKLPETPPLPGSFTALSAADAEAKRIHAELAAFDRAISERPRGGEPSLHELVGAWFAIDEPAEAQAAGEVHGVPITELLHLESVVKEIMERGARESYATNPWRGALQGDLAAFLARPHTDWQERLARLAHAAERADDCMLRLSPPFAATGDATEEGHVRKRLGALVEDALSRTTPQALAQWLSAEEGSARLAASELRGVARTCVDLIYKPVDRELATAVIGANLAVSEITEWMDRLTSYLGIARKWYAFLLFGRLRRARKVLARLRLSLGDEAAQRALKFFERLRARKRLEAVAQRLGRPQESASDAELTRMVEEHTAIFRVVAALDEEPLLRPIAKDLKRAFLYPENHAELAAELTGAEERGAAIQELEGALRDTGLLSSSAQAAVSLAVRQGQPASPLVAGWVERLFTVEGLLRIESLLAATPPELATLLRQLLDGAVSSDTAWAAVRKAVLSAEIARRIQSTPVLQTVDGDRVATAHRRYRELNAHRRVLTRDLVQHVWISKQRERLLASTGTRLNATGAEVRRRLVTRGERAMRVRQLIAAGAGIDGGDPLFDLRPVWMASPDVVAQLFPREPLFDVVIFDEASQCRLEEGLPILLRAKRVVIAGDPQQLPPTRFFEAGVAPTKEQEEETEQGLFEAQQSEVEDLLGAALNLSVEQAYLDVHYRSSNADLIGFSNQHFYESRLQPIPAHPSTRLATPPLRLVRAGGVYHDRTNLREVAEVVRIVMTLLQHDQPPSIGIACFNMNQRDAIVEALDRAGGDNPDFGARLAEARERKGPASFEGLFVRNLENVQGDERDHIIISTTYGPDKQGRFFRRFGPLGMAGGGRRLNVLITRARQMVHLVTSIPEEAYRGLAPLPAGAVPNGGWLLFAYLAYAEQLERLYADESRRTQVPVGAAECQVRNCKNPSEFAAAIGRHLAAGAQQSSIVHWGNDGFCIDAALVHPRRPDDITVGVLCDGSRFDKAADRVQWDIFRTEMLEAQRWKLFRVWSPQFFRDPQGAIGRLEKAVDEWQAEEDAKRRAAMRKKPSGPPAF